MANTNGKPSDRHFSLATTTATGKDLIALLRDAALLAMAVLLVIWPGTFNNILVNAGFEEGSFAGLKWKKKLSQADIELVSAQSTIADLQAQNDKLAKALADARPQSGNPDVRAQAKSLDQINQQVMAASSKVQASVASAISDNTPLVQKLESSTGAATTWGVVFSGDTKLDTAQYEVRTAGPKVGIPNAAIYYRQGSYRSVAIASDRQQAEQLLSKAKQRRGDAYIVNMATWCPNKVDKADYFECVSP
jgi:hypothetical protein